MPDTARQQSLPASSASAIAGDAAGRQARLAARMESASSLAGSVAHDLNNILTSVLGFAGLLAEQVADDPDAAANVREVLASGERAAALTQQLVALGGRQPLVPRDVTMAAVLNDLRPRLEACLGADVELSVAQDLDDIHLTVDVDRLQDALLACADNAREAMPSGGRFTIEVDVVRLDAGDSVLVEGCPPGSYVRIAAIDSGRGIPWDVQERIFDPFFSTKRRGHGVGLGLTRVYAFIKQSGGCMSVGSEPGRGTTATIHLPATRLAGPVASVSHLAPVPSGSGETVLVVDDVDAVRAFVAGALRRAGYRVLVASSASDALYMAVNSRGPIHLLLTDVVMPGSSGLDLARELRAERRGLKVLYMSGHRDNAVARSGHLHADEAFVQKPFTGAALLGQVAALLH